MSEVLDTADSLDTDDRRAGANGARPAAVSVRGRPVRRAPLAWLPWAALGLAAVLGLLFLVFVVRVANDDDDDGARNDLSAAGRPLLPLPAGGLGAVAGQTAEGREMRVESVVADEGFWVGDASSSRVFVFLSDQAKASEGESPFQVEAGQSIDFTGVVKPLPADVADLGVEADEGADQLRQQGHFLELSRVALSE